MERPSDVTKLVSVGLLSFLPHTCCVSDTIHLLKQHERKLLWPSLIIFKYSVKHQHGMKS